MRKSVFKSEAGRDVFRTYYNQILSQFPFRQQFIETSFGKTFILAAGEEPNPPVILLHGSCSNSAFWFPEMMALSSSFRVYAIDIIGEAGNSEEYRPDIDSDDFAIWMKEVLDGLGLEKAVFIGNSLGGWMALKFATAYPERVSQLALIASSGLAEVRRQFLDKIAQTLQSDDSVKVDSDLIGENNIPKEVLEFMNLIVESYNPIEYMPVYSDNKLKRLNMPVLFIDGENDVIIDAQQSAQRLSSLLPSAKVHLLENCGHVIPNAIEYLVPFLMN